MLRLIQTLVTFINNYVSHTPLFQLTVFPPALVLYKDTIIYEAIMCSYNHENLGGAKVIVI